MASHAKYARRRRNAFLAAIALALLFIIVVILIIVGISKRSSTPSGDANIPTATTPAWTCYPYSYPYTGCPGYFSITFRRDRYKNVRNRRYGKCAKRSVHLFG